MKKKIENLVKRAEQVQDMSAQIRDQVSYYERLHVPGDPEYDYHFGGSQMPEIEELNLSINKSVTEVSSEIGQLFLENMGRIESQQEALEQQQDELHSVLTEMHGMVMQQKSCLAALSASMAGLEESYTEQPEI